MAEAEQDNAIREGVISDADRAAYRQRRRSRGFDFFDVGAAAEPPDDGAGDGSQAKKPDEGSGDPNKEPTGDGSQAKKPDEGSGDPNKEPTGDGSQAKKPDEGEGDPKSKEPNKQPEAISQEAFTARINRLNKRHERKFQQGMAERDAEIERLRAELGQRGGGGGGDGGTKDGGQTTGDGGAADAIQAAYEAIGVDGVGPDMGDYKTEAEWAADFDLWSDDKPLKHHPKFAEAHAKAQASGKRKPEGGGDGGGDQGNKQDAGRDQLLFATLEATAEENEDADADTPHGTELYDEFLSKLKSGAIRIQRAALEHIVESDDGMEMLSLLVESPAKAGRLFLKPEAVQGAELEKILQRARKRAEGRPKGEGEGEGKPTAKDAGGKVMPDAKGGSNRAGEADPSTMSQAEYVAWRRAQQKERGGRGSFFV